MTENADIKNWIEAGLPGSVATVTGDGHHFEARVVSDEFEGKNTLAQHRMVYAALGDKMKAEIHALSLVTLLPNE